MQQVAQTEDGQMQVAYGKRIIAVADSSSGANVTHCVVQETVAVVANPIYITAVPQLSYDSDVSDDSDVSESWHFIFFSLYLVIYAAYHICQKARPVLFSLSRYFLEVSLFFKFES